jgi:hypothetical protein
MKIHDEDDHVKEEAVIEKACRELGAIRFQ